MNNSQFPKVTNLNLGARWRGDGENENTKTRHESLQRTQWWDDWEATENSDDWKLSRELMWRKELRDETVERRRTSDGENQRWELSCELLRRIKHSDNWQDDWEAMSTERAYAIVDGRELANQAWRDSRIQEKKWRMRDWHSEKEKHS